MAKTRITRRNSPKIDYLTALELVEKRFRERGVAFRAITHDEVPKDTQAEYCDHEDLRVIFVRSTLAGHDQFNILLGPRPTNTLVLGEHYVVIMYPEILPDKQGDERGTWYFRRSDSALARGLLHELGEDLTSLCHIDGQDETSHHLRCLMNWSPINLQTPTSPLFLDLIDRILDRFLLGTGGCTRAMA